MNNRHIALAIATIIGTTYLGPAMAQNQPAMQNQRTTATPSGSSVDAGMNFITARDANTWRASELIGKDVYGSNNEDIGEVGDVLVNRNGQVIGVVLDVGGFLGLGETNVAVPMTALQFRNEDNRTARAGTANTTGTNTTGANTTGSAMTGNAMTGTAGTRNQTRQGTATTAANQNGIPERIYLVVTKEQLQAAPKFDDEARSNATTGNTNTNNTMPSKGGTMNR